MDLKSYSNTDPYSNYRDKKAISEDKQESSKGGLSENDIRRAIKHFSGMSNDQLMRELSKHINTKKRQGKEVEIASTVDRIKPLLNPEQRKRLEDIMKNMN